MPFSLLHFLRLSLLGMVWVAIHQPRFSTLSCGAFPSISLYSQWRKSKAVVERGRGRVTVVTSCWKKKDTSSAAHGVSFQPQLPLTIDASPFCATCSAPMTAWIDKEGVTVWCFHNKLVYMCDGRERMLEVDRLRHAWKRYATLLLFSTTAAAANTES